jgi:hypothetical protein
MYVPPMPKPLYVLVLCQKAEEADRVSAQQIEGASRLVFPTGRSAERKAFVCLIVCNWTRSRQQFRNGGTYIVA